MNRRIAYFDVLNIAACLGVIFLHCNGNAHIYADNLAWKQALLIEVWLYWPVPVFFMLSGATLMDYRDKYDTKTFFLRRSTKTVIPFIFWSLLNVLIYSGESFLSDPRVWINSIILTKAENIYWFFIPLFAVYIAMPVLSLLKDNRRILRYMTGAAFILMSVLPVVLPLAGISHNSNMTIPVAGGYVIFVLLGYILSTEDIPKKSRIAIYLLGAAGGLFRLIYTYVSSTAKGAIDKTLFNYIGFYSVLLASAVFVLFRYSPIDSFVSARPRLASVLRKTAGCSFGIYLIHMLIFRELIVKFIRIYTWPFRLIAPFIIYAIGLAVVLILKKVPVLRKLIP